MITTEKTADRPLATLPVARKSVPSLLAFARSLVASMTDNPAFPHPSPTLAAVSAAMDALTAAEVDAATRTRGTVAVRDVKRLALIELLQALRAYVQLTADADPATAAAVIESAGLPLRKKLTRAPRVFSLRLGRVSGEVKVVVPSAGERAAYHWQYSTDGGARWIDAPPTAQAQTVIEGLAPTTVLSVRYRAITPRQAGDWSAPVSMTVL